MATEDQAGSLGAEGSAGCASGVAALGEEIDLLRLKNFTVRVETDSPPLLDVTQLVDAALVRALSHLLPAVGN